MHIARMDKWIKVAALLAQQHGVVALQQLRGLGLGRHTVDGWVAQSRLERCAPRVFRLVGSPITWEQRLTKGLLSLGPDSAVSHRAAAILHGLDRAAGGHVEFLVANRQRSSQLDETVHCSKMFSAVDVVNVRGFRATSATRTILDLASIDVHPDRLRAAIDSAVRLQLSAPEVIRRRLLDIRRRGRAGARLIDDLLDESGGHSMLERHFLRLMREGDLPRPECQVIFRDGVRTLARVDFLFRTWNVVVEVSGQLCHSTPSDRARDARRRNELQDLGLRVYEFTWDDVTRRPAWVLSEMRARLVAAGWSA